MRRVLGIHSAAAVLRHRINEVQSVMLSDSRTDEKLAEIESLAERIGVEVTRVPKETLREFARGHPHQGVIVLCHQIRSDSSRGNVKQWLSTLNDASFLIVLDDIQDPRNLGACIRSANAAGVGGIMLPRNRGCDITATVSRTASGAAEITPIYKVSNLARGLDELKSAGIWVIGLDSNAADSIFDVDLTEPCAIVFGAEDRGLRKQSQKKCDVVARIPMQGETENLNVSVAVGVVSFDIVRQRANPGSVRK